MYISGHFSALTRHTSMKGARGAPWGWASQSSGGAGLAAGTASAPGVAAEVRPCGAKQWDWFASLTGGLFGGLFGEMGGRGLLLPVTAEPGELEDVGRLADL